MDKVLKPFWNRLFKFNSLFGLFLVLTVCIPRFILVMHANATGNYGSIGLIMAISAIVPFIFLSKKGRAEIGITKPQKNNRLLLAFAAGLVASILLYWIGQSLYGNSYENWYKYIGKSYKIPADIGLNDKRILFAVMAFTGMTFSPVGEELFFRGIVHASFAKSLGDKKASLIDGAAFALTHLSHFGLVFINFSWQFLVVPSLVWVTAMFLVSLLFFACRKYTGSILGVILCHAAFNGGMIYCIFYLL